MKGLSILGQLLMKVVLNKLKWVLNFFRKYNLPLPAIRYGRVAKQNKIALLRKLIWWNL